MRAMRDELRQLFDTIVKKVNAEERIPDREYESIHAMFHKKVDMVFDKGIFCIGDLFFAIMQKNETDQKIKLLQKKGIYRCVVYTMLNVMYSYRCTIKRNVFKRYCCALSKVNCKHVRTQ